MTYGRVANLVTLAAVEAVEDEVGAWTRGAETEGFGLEDAAAWVRDGLECVFGCLDGGI